MELIKEIDLVHRRVYRIRSRNLLVGVWDEDKHGFMGIRKKFDSEYLFMEYHWDYSPHVGTVRGMEAVDPEAWWQHDLRSGWSLCEVCETPVTFIRYIESVNGKIGFWEHDEPWPDGSDQVHAAQSYHHPNLELFDFLKPFHRAELARFTEENRVDE